MSKPYVIHFISNTHWDREWLMNFQETRIMLVDMMDRLLEVMEKEPGYRSFVLDSQTVPIEDYLEARPHNRKRVVRLIEAGRLLIGPWYTDPEGFCLCGESLVRNLLMGHRVAKSFGGVMKIGHTSFGYGQNSQMPQIYRGFGIDTMLFYHGVSHDEVPNEWIFEGADGSRVLGSQMSSYARYNAYQNLYRAALYGDRIDERTYTWDRGGMPFKMCRPDAALRHHYLLEPVRGWHTELLDESIRALRAKEIDVATTRHLAFMMGHDSSVPDAVELKIIERVKELFPEDEVLHDTYPAMMEAIKAEVEWDKLVTLKGERRTPKLMPVTMHLYSDVLSSRTRMKRANALAEYLLQRRAEPFAAAAAMLGVEYPTGLLEIAWKTLLKCHAHDSIAGSGVDDIERDMMYRLRQVTNISTGVLRNALGEIQKRVDMSAANANDVLVTVFNPSFHKRSGVVTAQVDLPYTGPLGEFQLVDLATGAPARVQAASRKPQTAIINHAHDAPANMKAERFTVHLDAEKIPALGYACYRVDRTARFTRGGLVVAANTMENDALNVRIESDGTLTVLHKATGEVFDGLNYFLDNGEAGHAWMHHNPARDRVIDSRGFPVRIALEEDGALLARYRVECRMDVPARLEENGGDAWQRLDGIGNAAGRSEDTVPLTVTSWVTLRRGAKSVEIVVRFDNAAKNHRLRAMFPTRRKGAVCHVESAFDVIERETVFSPESAWHGTKGVTFPMQRFVDVSDEKAGLAVLNDGLREYEVTQDADRAIAVTLMRAYQVSLCPVSKCWEELPEMELAQCPGAHEFAYNIYPHAGDWAQGNVFVEAEALTVPLEAAQAGVHEGALPPRHGFVSVAPEALVVTAFKAAEEDAGWVLRLFNPTDTEVEAALSFAEAPSNIELVSLEETNGEALPLKNNTARFTLGPKKIGTVMFW